MELLLSMEQTGLLYLSSTDPQEYFLIMTKENLMQVENCYLIAELYLIEVPGLILSMMLKIYYILE